MKIRFHRLKFCCWRPRFIQILRDDRDYGGRVTPAWYAFKWLRFGVSVELPVKVSL